MNTRLSSQHHVEVRRAPKGVTNFQTLTQADLDATAHELNGRPRQTLGWKNPRQALTELPVATTP